MSSNTNFATIGSLEKNTGGFTFSQGNLKYSVSTNNRGFICSAGFPDTGKWYYEMYIIGVGGSEDQVFIGVCNPDTMRANLTQSRGGAQGSYGGYVFDNYDGKAYLNGTGQSADSIGNFRSFPQKVGILVNRDDDEIKWTLNGSDLSSAYTIPTGPLYPYIGSGGGSTEASGVFNFGQDSTFGGAISAGGNSDSNGFGDFTFSVPSNYVALASANLPISDDIDPAEEKGPNTHFDVVTYTGNGSTQSITSLGFQPDWTLIKNRASGDWCNQNSSLGVGKVQLWNDDGGVADDDDCVTAFNSNGFSLGDDSKVNTSSANYVAYCWKKSAAAGLDIVTYSGGGGSQAVSHSLGATPDCIFIMLNTGSAWDSIMYLNSPHMGTSYGIFPTLTNARQNSTYVSATTSSNFTVTTSADTSGRTYFAYVLKSIEGFSKFGEYIANADADGPFTYLGFRPRLLIIKALESGQTWFFYDTARSTSNPVNRYLYGQRDLAEDTAGSIDIDFLASGFKIRNSRSDTNSSSGDAYAYLAWADVPYKYNNTF